MTYSRVNLQAEDTVRREVVKNVVFKVLSEDTQMVFGTFDTDDEGTAGLLLPPGTYEVRPYRFSYNFGPPRRIIVLPEDEVVPVPIPNNDFVFPCQTYYAEGALDPNLCRATGYFRNPGGGPLAGVALTFTPLFRPIIVGNAVMMQEKVRAVTHGDGRMEVTLVRGAIYIVDFESYGGVEQHQVYVPDQAWVELSDLIFPRVERVHFTTLDTLDWELGISLRVGELRVLPGHVHATDGRLLPLTEVLWELGHPTVVDSMNRAALEITNQEISLLGRIPGRTYLKPMLRSPEVISLPWKPLVPRTLMVEVTP